MSESIEKGGLHELSLEDLKEMAFKEILDEKKRTFLEKHPDATEAQVQAVENNFRRIYGLDVQKMENQVHDAYAKNYESGADNMRKEISELVQELMHSTTGPERKAEINAKMKQLEKDIEDNERIANERRGMVKE